VADVAIPMPDTLATVLGVKTSAASLLLPAQGAHIARQRRDERSEIISALPEALERVEYVEYVGTQAAHKFVAVGRCRTGRLLFMALKFVRVGEPARDEAWISTAYFVGNATLRRKVRNKKLRQVLHRSV
jgi:hypothetical protein